MTTNGRKKLKSKKTIKLATLSLLKKCIDNQDHFIKLIVSSIFLSGAIITYYNTKKIEKSPSLALLTAKMLISYDKGKVRLSKDQKYWLTINAARLTATTSGSSMPTCKIKDFFASSVNINGKWFLAFSKKLDSTEINYLKNYKLLAFEKGSDVDDCISTNILYSSN